MKPGQFNKATPKFMGFKFELQRTSIANHLSMQVFPSPKPGVGSTYPGKQIQPQVFSRILVVWSSLFLFCSD